MTKLYSTEELIHHFGSPVNDRRCGRCQEFNLHKVQYRDAKDVVLLCDRCDVSPASAAMRRAA